MRKRVLAPTSAETSAGTRSHLYLYLYLAFSSDYLNCNLHISLVMQYPPTLSYLWVIVWGPAKPSE